MKAILCSLMILSLSGMTPVAFAQEPGRRSVEQAIKGDAAAAARFKDDKQFAFTPAREAAVLSFVQHHHPELAELLNQLKSNNQREYQRAAQELFRASERLALSKERDPQRYELELQGWKLESRIRLAAARLHMADSPTLREELKSLIRERNDLQIAQQELEVKRLQARLDKLESSISQARAKRDANVQAALDKLLAGIAPAAEKAKPLPVKTPAQRVIPTRPAPPKSSAKLK